MTTVFKMLLQALSPLLSIMRIALFRGKYHPVLREEVLTKCGWSPFEGWNLTGWPVYTIVGGQVVYEKGKLNTDVRGEALTFDV
jgi:hypothetical protein